MKKYIITLYALLLALIGVGQTDGLNYQAIIIDRNAQELPGVDIQGNYLSDEEVSLKFTVLDVTENIEFQEIQHTRTDTYGMVNLIIGQGETTGSSPGSFDEIEWDGSAKDLGVEISYGGADFELFSKQPLLFVPYAYHRNITATGTLMVDGTTTLNSDLVVANASPTLLTGDLTVMGDADFQGNTQFNSITVLNESDLQGTLNVGGPATMNNTLDVIGTAILHNSLDVLGSTTLAELHVLGSTLMDDTLHVNGWTEIDNTFNVISEFPSNFSGDVNIGGNTFANQQLLVDGAATFYDNISVIGTSTHLGESFMSGQVTIDVTLGAGQSDYDNYPLRVEGSAQGIAIKSTMATPNSNSNFITFFDSNENAVGRIEGQTQSEMTSSAEYIFETAVLTANVVSAAAGLVGASTSSTICVGLGGCATAPIPSLVISAGIASATAVANLAAYQIFAYSNLGVTYESGSADYAEWLERAHPEEVMSFGDIVAVNGGLISKNGEHAERWMVISHKPAVLGNMPDAASKDRYEMVAFLGQVPVKIYGTANVGDYILPSGMGDGFGRAVNPDQMRLEDYPNIVGVAWSASDSPLASYINVAIGMNQNDLYAQVEKQQADIDLLKQELADLKAIITGGRPADDTASTVEKPSTGAQTQKATAEEMHYEVSRDELEQALDRLKELLEDQGMEVDTHPYLSSIFNDPDQREEMLQRIHTMVLNQREWAVNYDRSHGFK
ncbi:MAG: hypothetical protein HKN79_10225 [Flavobacteriales bacterium]|nr:hypothetical protein [Flavobacteriales bacterium]